MFSYATTLSAEQITDLNEKVDILIGLAPNLNEALVESLPELKWVHTLTTGVGNLLASRTLHLSVFISNSTGLHGPQMSELAILLMLVPYSRQTHHIIEGTVMAAMQPHANLINLARGGCVDEDALQKHLSTGSIRTAALDVFEQEPLPAENPLWDSPAITITPHIGGMSDNYRERVLPVVIENLKAWHNGGGLPLPGRIMREKTT